MAASTLISNARVINEGLQFEANIYIKNGLIWDILPLSKMPIAEQKINANGQLLLPGVIDDQVHFREPGLTHKGNIYSESRAAVAGGVTSFMEMPNTSPAATTIERLEQKYAIAAKSAQANYSFFMGASSDNLEELLKINPENVCGVKIFMGSSTGNLLVEDYDALSAIFSKVPWLIATHCESDPLIAKGLDAAKAIYADNIPASMHPTIRSREACLASSTLAVDLAKKHGARLHVLHISTADELKLFSNELPIEAKKITAEACIHHLWFTDADYEKLGMFLKWNPAVKSETDRAAIRKAVIENIIDVIATDHAPHTIEEKQQNYIKAPSGGPLVQHSLQAMLQLVNQGIFSIEKVVEKMCHNPAILFRINKRGFIRPGYFADLVLVANEPYQVSPQNTLYHCKWSPFMEQIFDHTIKTTIINGKIAYYENKFLESNCGERLTFLV